MAGDEAEFSEDTKSTVKQGGYLFAGLSFLGTILLCSFKRVILEI